MPDQPSPATAPPRPDLLALVAKHETWNRPTHDERWAARRRATPQELREFYDDVRPLLRDILAECDRFPLGELPETHYGLLNLAFAFAEVAPHVELYGGSAKVPNSFDEAKFVASRGAKAAWADFV